MTQQHTRTSPSGLLLSLASTASIIVSHSAIMSVNGTCYGEATRCKSNLLNFVFYNSVPFFVSLRDLYLAWERRIEAASASSSSSEAVRPATSTTRTLPQKDLQKLFNDINLYPSQSQIFEMVQVHIGTRPTKQIVLLNSQILAVCQGMFQPGRCQGGQQQVQQQRQQPHQ